MLFTSYTDRVSSAQHGSSCVPSITGQAHTLNRTFICDIWIFRCDWLPYIINGSRHSLLASFLCQACNSCCMDSSGFTVHAMYHFILWPQIWTALWQRIGIYIWIWLQAVYKWHRTNWYVMAIFHPITLIYYWCGTVRSMDPIAGTISTTHIDDWIAFWLISTKIVPHISYAGGLWRCLPSRNTFDADWVVMATFMIETATVHFTCLGLHYLTATSSVRASLYH